MVILLFTFLFYNQASCPFTRDNPIKTADSIVNTYAWMNATRISNASINTECYGNYRHGTINDRSYLYGNKDDCYQT